MADYTLLLLAPNRPARAREVVERVRARLVAFGLRREALAVCDPATFDPAAHGPAAAVYFGGPEHRDACTRLAADFVGKGRPVLPVVPTLVDYPGQVPDALHGVNGLADDGSEGRLDEIVNCLLIALGFVRSRRRVFISYKRSASTGVADQLAAALPAAGWTVFLDTQSVERGAMFQPALWDAMADTDLVVFLDTPDALQSHWVAEEFARANDQGITLLRLVWPDRARVREAELSEAVPLGADDFLRHRPHTWRSGRLRRPKVRQIIETLEHLRAEAFAARRSKLVEGFVRRVREREVSADLQADGHIRVERRDGRSAVIVPVVGHPESLHFERAHQLDDPPDEVRVLYDGTGLHPDRVRHLGWLDTHLPIKTLPLDEVPAWMSQP